MSERKLPPHEVVLDLIQHQGLSTQEVADRYGVTRPAVSYCLRQNHVVAPRAPMRYDMPWRVRVEHNNDPLIRKVRLWMRSRMPGVELRPDQQAALDQFLAHLERIQRVVAYNPESGFLLVPRMDSDGDQIIRWPAP